MMNASQTVPHFPSTIHGHPALRAMVILGLCAALLFGFVVSSSRLPGPAARDGAQANSVACDVAAAARHAC